MRAFIAIELPADIKSSLSRLQERLKKSGADVKWVEPNNIHITLKFLGDRDDKKIEKIAEAIEETSKNYPPFSASISSVGAFPKISAPRVIWVGINQGEAEIKKIALELEERIARLGIPKEDKPFTAHITIGRTRSGLNLEKLVEGLNKTADFWLENKLQLEITKITLFKSTLTSNGPVYEPLTVSNLKTI